MSQRLQINSLAALERLIGNDTALELEIRQNIAEEFAKKHIKCLAEEFSATTAGKFAKEMREQVNDEVSRSLGEALTMSKGTYWSDPPKMILRDDGKEAIRNEVRRVIADVRNEAIKETTENLKKEIAVYVKHDITKEVARQVQAGVAARLEELRKTL